MSAEGAPFLKGHFPRMRIFFNLHIYQVSKGRIKNVKLLKINIAIQTLCVPVTCSEKLGCVRPLPIVLAWSGYYGVYSPKWCWVLCAMLAQGLGFQLLLTSQETVSRTVGCVGLTTVLSQFTF